MALNILHFTGMTKELRVGSYHEGNNIFLRVML